MINAFMQEAIRKATENVRGGHGGPFGAVVVRRRQGYRERRKFSDYPRPIRLLMRRSTPSAKHALQLGTFQLTGCEIYTSCEPCPMCLGAIYWARPDECFMPRWPVTRRRRVLMIRFIYEELKLAHADRRIPFEQIMGEAGLQPFQEWTQKDDRIRY